MPVPPGSGAGGRWAAAATAWPRLRPPSLQGTRWWVSTRKPWRRSRSVMPPSSRVLANTPPDSATVPSPVASATRRTAAVTASASPWWKRAAITPVATPAAQVRRHRPDQVGAGDHDRRAGGHGDRVAVADGPVGPLLQLHRRLALVARPVADAGQGGDRVEQPPGARGERRGGAAGGQHGGHRLPGGRVAGEHVEAVGRARGRRAGRPPPSATAGGRRWRRRASAPAPDARPGRTWPGRPPAARRPRRCRRRRGRCRRRRRR